MAVETTDAGLDDGHDGFDRGPRWPWIAGTLLSVLGLGVAAYLTYEHFTGSTTLACPTAGAHSIVDCAKVTTSPWSVEFGLPVAVLGLVYFAVMLALQSPWAWRLQWFPVRAGRVLWCVVGIGNAIVLVYDELYRIHAICEWCTSVHLLTFLLFVSTVFGTISTAPLPDDPPAR